MEDVEQYTDPVLYILMRQDMDSLTSGKAMAQAAHAANQFVESFGNGLTPGYHDWKAMTDEGFGTTIVLAVFGETSLRYYLENALNLGHPAGMVLDPTYPVSDGDVMHLIPVNTCGYVFVKDRHNNGGALLEGLELHG